MPRVRFLAGTGLVFCLLIVPWPGWNERYAAWFGRIGAAAFSSGYGRLEVRFEPAPPTADRPFSLRLTLVDRDRIRPDGTAPAVMVGLDARGLAWVPTALVVALILSTPLPWPRRLSALALALVAVHGYVLFLLGVVLVAACADPSGLALLQLPPFVGALVDGLDETLVTQMGPGLAAAVVLWILVTLRRRDLGPLLAVALAGRDGADPTPANGWPRQTRHPR